MLDKLNESSHAFKVLHAYLKLVGEKEDLSKTEAKARRCVILAIKSVDVINFAELLELPAIKNLTQKEATVFKLLNLLSQSSAKEFAAQIGQFKDLMKAENLLESEVITKKSYVEICSLDTQTTNFTYT